MRRIVSFRSLHLLSSLLLLSGLLWTGAAAAQDSDVTRPLPANASAPVTGPVPFPIAVIYTNIATDPSSDVPGLPGVKFDPGVGTTHFDRIYGSPNGNWVLTALADLPTAEDELLIANGVLEAREGTAATWAPGELVGLLDTTVGINDSGEFTFTTNTDGPTATDEYVVKGTTGALSDVAQEGDSASPPLPAGALWGSTLETAVVTADGTIGFISDAVGGLPTTQDEVVVLGSTVLAQEGVTMPAGQIGAETWENFDVSDFWVTPDGMHHLLQGDLTGATATDGVVAVDGTVVVQEGVVLAGSGFAEPVDLSGIVGVHLAPNGRYLVRGNNDVTEQDWVYSNGAVVATLGAPITTGASELWSDVDFGDCYFLHVGNGKGDYVIGGVTDAPSATNGVLVLNDEAVLVREGDPLDLDGNGMFDDDTFFDTFGNDDAVLADNGIFYFVATVKDGTGTRIGQGVFALTYEVPDLIYTDGFETGDTSQWNVVEPP